MSHTSSQVDSDEELDIFKAGPSRDSRVIKRRAANETCKRSKRRRIFSGDKLDADSVRRNAFVFTEEDFVQSKLRKFHDSLSISSKGSKLAQHGNIFQLKLLMLILWRAKTNPYTSFRLATELSECESFDDVVFQYEHDSKWKLRLIQAKHLEGITDTKTKIQVKDVISMDDKSKFSLQKYFISFTRIKQRIQNSSIYSIFWNSEIEDVVICTNIGVSEMLALFLTQEAIENDAILNINNFPSHDVSPKTCIHKVDISKNTQLFEDLQEIFIETSEFHVLISELAMCITQGIQIEKDGIFRNYYLILSELVFDVEQGKFKTDFVNCIGLNDNETKFRSSLLKEITFILNIDKYKVQLSKDFGDPIFPKEDNELEDLAFNFADDIIKKRIGVKTSKYHIFLASGVIDVENNRIFDKFICKPSKLKRLLKDKLTLLNHNTRITDNDLRKVEFKIPPNFGKTDLSTNCIKKICYYVESEQLMVPKEFEGCNVTLANDVFDTEKSKWRDTFIFMKSKDDKSFSPSIAKFRRMLIDELVEETQLKTSTINKIKIKFSNGYKKSLCSSEINFLNVEKFVDQIGKIISLADKNDNKVVIDKFSVPTGDLNEFQQNFRQLGGQVLVKRFNKIRFSSYFLKSDNLPDELEKLRKLLKNKLTSKFSLLFEYEFNIADDKFKTYEEDVLETRLPVLCTKDDVSDFLTKLKIIAGYPNRDQITELLKNEMQNYFKETDSNDFNALYQEILHDWMANRIGTYYSARSMQKLFDDLRNDISFRAMQGVTKAYISNIKSNYKFKDVTEIFNFLIHEKHQILQIQAASFNLARIRVTQTFENLKCKNRTGYDLNRYIWDGGHLFISTKNLIDTNFMEDVLKCFQNKINLLIVEYSSENYRYLFDALQYAILDDSLIKRIILISTDNKANLQKQSDNSKNQPRKSLTQSEKCVEVSLSCKFNDLLESSKTKLFDNYVYFQKQYLPLEELVGVNDNANDIFDPATLEMLVIADTQTVLSIFDETYELGDIKDYYISRKLSKNGIITENDLIDDENKTISISDVAGMGKSTLLAKLFALIKIKYKNYWVIKFDLNDYTKDFFQEQNSKKFDLDDPFDVLKFLLRLGSENSKLQTRFEEQLFFSNLNNNGNIVLLFDAFDEISPQYNNIVLKMLETLQHSNIYKIVVTTRPNVKRELEEELKIISYSIEPYSKEDQIQFLKEYWGKKIFKYSIITKQAENRLKTYVESLISKFYKSLDEGEANRFTGVALQLRMIAEIFLNQKSTTGFEWQGCENFVLSENEIPLLPDYFNLYRLYKEFINKKYIIYFETKKREDLTNVSVQNDHKIIERAFFDQHQILALYSILSYYKNLFISREDEFDASIKKLGEGKEIVGLVDSVNSTHTAIIRKKVITFTSKIPRFVHRTFAEYFVALYFSDILLLGDRLGNLKDELCELMLTKLLVKSEFKIIRYFINSRLSEALEENVLVYKLSQLEDIICVLWKENKFYTDFDEEFFLHVLARENHLHIILFLWKCISEKCKNILIEKRDRYGTSVLHLAAKYGHFELVQWLLKPIESGGGGVNCEVKDTDGHTSLLAASHWERIVKWLVKDKDSGGGGADVNAQYRDGDQLIHRYIERGNIDMVKWLLLPKTSGGGGVAIHVEDEDGNKLVHYCANSSIFVELLSWMIETYGQSENAIDIYAKDRAGDTIFHYAAFKGKLDILKWLVTPVSLGGIGGRLDLKSDNGSTLLHEAALSGNLELVTWLLSSDHNPPVDVFAKDHNDRTVFHDAAKFGNLNVIKLLSRTHKLSLHDRDTNGVSVLDEAMTFGSLELVQLIVETSKSPINNTESNLLHLAAMHGEWSLVQWLITNVKIDINFSDANKRTALHKACQCANIEVVKWLIANDAKVNIVDSENRTPLHHAVTSHYTTNINKWLIDRNCYVKYSELGNDGVYKFVIPSSDVLESIKKQLYNKIREIDCGSWIQDDETICFYVDKFSMIKNLLEKNARIDIKDKYGKSVLHYAVRDNFPRLIELLIENVPKDDLRGAIDDKDEDEKTIFHYAVDNDEHKSIEFLLNLRSLIENDVTNDNTYANNISIINYALRLEKTDSLKAIFDLIGKDEWKRKSKTLLYHAIEYDNLELLQYLLTKPNMDTLFCEDDQSRTIMYCIAKYNSLKCVQYLITPRSKEGHGLDVNLTDPSGKTLLHYAVIHMKTKLVKWLINLKQIQGGPMKASIKDSHQMTALHYAVIFGYTELVKLLLTSTLPSNEILNVDERSNDSQTLLHSGVEFGKLEIVSWLAAPKPKGGAGADINAEDGHGKTPLHYAGIYDHFYIVKWLVWPRRQNGGGADIYAGDCDGKTILHYVAQAGNFAIFNWLVTPRSEGGGGMDQNIKDIEGNTPLQILN